MSATLLLRKIPYLFRHHCYSPSLLGLNNNLAPQQLQRQVQQNKDCDTTIIRYGIRSSGTTSPNCTAGKAFFSTTANKSDTIDTSNAKDNNSKAKNKGEEQKKTLSQLNLEKQKAKDRRRELYNLKTQNRIQRKHRRNSARKNHNKKAFKRWYDPYTSHHYYLTREAKRRGLEWKHEVSVLLERLPIVTPDLEDWEKDFMSLSCHLDKYRKKSFPKELVAEFDDSYEDKAYTMEEILELLPEGLKLMPRETEADETGFYRTLDRKLKTRVYLAIRPNDEKGWMVPTVDLKSNETLVDGAKRAVEKVSSRSNDLVIRCFGNAPMGVSLKANDKGSDTDGIFGTKTFFMKVQYESGNVYENELNKVMGDWGWLDRREIAERIKQEKGENIGLFYHHLL